MKKLVKKKPNKQTQTNKKCDLKINKKTAKGKYKIIQNMMLWEKNPM